MLVSDQAFVGDPPGVADLDGHKLVVASSAAATGGPAPGDRIGGIGLRQRILSEAALRLLEPGRDPLVVVLPNGLTSEGADGLLRRARRALARPHHPDPRGRPRRPDHRARRHRLPRAPGRVRARPRDLPGRRRPDRRRRGAAEPADPQRPGRRRADRGGVDRGVVHRPAGAARLASRPQPRPHLGPGPARLRSDRRAARRDPLQRHRRLRRHDHQPARRAGDRLGAWRGPTTASRSPHPSRSSWPPRAGPRCCSRPAPPRPRCTT